MRAVWRGSQPRPLLWRFWRHPKSAVTQRYYSHAGPRSISQACSLDPSVPAACGSPHNSESLSDRTGKGSPWDEDAGTPVYDLDQAAGIGPAWAWFRAKLGCQQPIPEFKWQAASESNGASKVLETSHRPAGDLWLAERTVAATDTLADTTRFPAGPESHSVYAPRMAEGGTTRKPCPKAPPGFEPVTAP